MNQQQLFAYGTLLDPQVQLRVIGRIVKGRAAILDGYEKILRHFSDGKFPDLRRLDGSVVRGEVLLVSDEELRLCDLYEGEEYERIKVKVSGGDLVWVYCGF